MRQEEPSLEGPSRAQRRLFGALMLLVTYLLLELVVFVFYRLTSGETFSFAAMAERRQALDAVSTPEIEEEVDEGPGNWTFEGSGLHPYLGFTRESDPKDRLNFGFRRVLSAPGSSNPIRVVIVGGSVAEDFYRYTVRNAQWLPLLRSVPGFEQAEFEHILLGLRGYKEPQQLQAVAYYLALGGKIDILINIDGFNEVVLSKILQENGTFAAYPFHWRAFTNSQPSPAQLLLLGEIEQHKKKRRGLARLAARLRFSVTASTLWHFVDRYLENGLEARRTELERQDAQTESYFRNGPVEALAGQDVAAFMTAVWARSSRQIAALAKENHFRYYHFLQPNQYVPGSKNFSALELQERYDEKSQVAEHVRKGYPLLLAAGQDLSFEKGLFRDLTPIFHDVSDTVYSDKICHLNGLGNTVLAREIVATLKKNDPRLR